jgi:hypothetical protein
MPTQHPRRRALIATGITIGVLTAAAGILASNRDAPSDTGSRIRAATSLPAARVPLPPINRAIPRPLPPVTDPVGFATQIATTLWGTQAPDVVGYQIMAATSPDLSDPELDQLTGIIDSEQASGPTSAERVDLVPASGIDEATTIVVTALDPPRSLRMRITCTPDCRLRGITR